MEIFSKSKAFKLLKIVLATLVFIPLAFFAYNGFLILQARAAATIYWDGGGDNVSWSDPLNWDTDAVPVSTDRVLIDADVTVNILEPISIEALTLGRLNGATAPTLNFGYDAITHGSLAVTAGDLIVYSNANVTHDGGTENVVGTVALDVSGNLAVYGSINVNKKGYTTSNGPGDGGDGIYGAGGAAYGGEGGDGASKAGSTNTYGDYTAPDRLGSGGGKHDNDSGYGGGAIKLVVGGTTTISGTVTANGGEGYGGHSTGGGSGGSVWIDTGIIAGSGVVTANGGLANNESYDGGGGGGGRIAIYYDSDTSAFSQLLAMGGKPEGSRHSNQKGGAGTVYLKDNADTYGNLIIDNGEIWYSDNRDKVALTPLVNSLHVKNLQISNYSNIYYNSDLIVDEIFSINNNAFFDSEATITVDSLDIDNLGWYFNQSSSSITYNILNWSGGKIVDNGGDFVLISGGGDLLVPSGSVLYGNEPRTYTNLTVNGTLTHTGNTDQLSTIYKLNYTISGDLTVNGSGEINVNNKGYSRGNGPGDGEDGSHGAGGAAYGGEGGDGGARAGSTNTYGDYTAPDRLGSGGGYNDPYGGYGGGAIKLVVEGTTTVSGTITANGGEGYRGYSTGGGSGGSVWIDTGTLSGSGIVTANGGTVRNESYDGGGGGGGRIAIYYDSDTSAFSQVLAMGGKPEGSRNSNQKGGAGTVYLKNNGDTYGDLIIDNGQTNWYPDNRDRVAYTPLVDDLHVKSLVIDRYANVDYASNLTVDNGLLIDNYSHFGLRGVFNVDILTLSNEAWLYNESTGDMTYGSFSWSDSKIVDNGGDFVLISGGGDLLVPSGSVLYGNEPRSYTNLTVNGTLTHTGNTDQLSTIYKLNYTISGDLTVNGSGEINVNSKGYSRGNGPGDGEDGSHGAGGAAYGGEGGDGGARAGSTNTYGDYTAPDRLGSGGGYNDPYGGYGGGAIKLVVEGTTTVSGTITANGGEGYRGYSTGGGSGGSVWIDTGTLSGSGIVTANGGTVRNESYDGGGGGGGRIAIYYDSDTSAFSQVLAMGGKPEGSRNSNQKGGAGTVYLKNNGDTYGDLIIDNGQTNWYPDNRDRVAYTPLVDDLHVKSLVIDRYANVDYASNLTVDNGLLIDNYSHFGLRGVFNVDILTLSNEAWLYNETGSSTSYSSLIWSGNSKIVDDGGDLPTLSSGNDLIIPSDVVLYGNYPRTFMSITVNGYLTHQAFDGGSETPKINYTGTNYITIGSTGTIDVTGRGYPPSTGEGQGQDANAYDGAGGAGYGGSGGNGDSWAVGGSVYGEESWKSPLNYGSGGGNNLSCGVRYGGIGGGVVKLTTEGVLTVEGSIISDGETPPYHGDCPTGGGSGGSVYLTLDTLAGSGTITAMGGNGGDGSGEGGGGGGGGRIAIYYSANDSSLSNLSVAGGNGTDGSESGGEGTIFWGGYPLDPISLRQYKTDGSTGIGAGGSTDETSMIVKFQLQDANSTDTLIPEVEIAPLGSNFNNVATHTGAEVAYTGTAVDGVVTVDGLADQESYHWQGRVCDVDGLCSEWVSFGGNLETEPDVSVGSNMPPSPPTIPETTYYIDGQLTNNINPTIGFVLSDSDASDSVQYRIQMDTEDTFTTPFIDYVSELGSQGTVWFTVGQDVGSGEYLVGSAGQELTTESYYWRVKAIDIKEAESAWTVAPGDPAFRIDLTRPTNATNVGMKADVSALHRYTEDGSTYWFKGSEPYFNWDPGTDDEGIKGYCLYLGQNPDGDPAAEKGILGSSPVSTTGTGCGFIVDTTEIDFSTTSYRSIDWLTSSNDPYYFKVKAMDVANNLYVGPDVTNYISFNYDSTPPDNVTSISAPSSTFSGTSEMYFNWTTGGNGGSDDHSGVLGFQYAVNSRDTWYGNTTDDFTGIDYFPTSTEQPFYLEEEAREQIHLGQNTAFYRMVDVAGNYSDLRTVMLNYGGEAPKFAQGEFVSVYPESNTVNEFEFSWPAAEISEGQTLDNYYYMINTPPPLLYDTITSNSATYVPTQDRTVSAQSFPGLRKGSNIVYVVAVDDAGNYSPSNYISKTFYLESELPDPPEDVVITDSSIKSASLWRVALVWEEPENKGTGTLTYVVQRSEEGEEWLNIAETQATAYVDTVPESKRYYWRIATVDNSDESKNSPSISNAVSIVPKGQYFVPATLTSGPAASSITTTRATISWTTSRGSDSKVAYGLGSGNYFKGQVYTANQITDHSISLTNLEPGKTYYYKARWTDEDGNTGESEERTFTTEPPPEVKEVRVTNVGVSRAIVNFTMANATKAKVYYGKTTEFGGVKEIGTSKLETSYTISLDNLEDGTKYYFRINAFDEENEEYEGTILDFETLPRPRVYDVKVQQVAKTAKSTLLVTWQSNTGVSSIVTFYPKNNPELVKDVVNIELKDGKHQMILRGLFPDTDYVIAVRGRDVIGNEAVSKTINIETSSDTRAPVISSLSVEGSNTTVSEGGNQETSSQLVITWHTDEPSTSQVEYGEGSGSSYAHLTQEDKNLSNNHVVIISGLTPSKVYHFRTISKDSAGNESRSVDTVTITPKATDDAFYLVLTTLQEAFGFLEDLRE